VKKVIRPEDDETKRIIRPELVKYIDERMELDGLAKVALANKDARTLMWLAGGKLVGISEATGRNDGKMVNLIQDTVGPPNQWPWCMSYVQTCIAYAELKTGKKSPIAVSEHCLTVWQQTPKEQRVKYLPLAGAIAIWNDEGKVTGHTEIVLSADKEWFLSCGGNTSGYFTRAQVKESNYVNREGNAVVFAKRSMKSGARRKLLGFLKPF